MNVKIARIKKGLTQTELCKILKISKTILVKIEKDDYDIRLSLMKKISEVLEVPVQELFLN
ncbi:helix-turn-helix domain protein [Clostridium tepidiprofundi DSM 19306]|uniref:Helix-turn-helix domain protein n=1 Tax=Clostridium tepidiprofundi DSM 19306 TaxID=1121338 RepID=A0A151AMY0_9CLOT|nr:helix-turn-helix transcriptional regulator [Clostridium tepidiprofundi]KYH28900.1 helix-turn-helix domain protein [Clostridium tepidiprofundi DSM 19306]